jgi:hypothetical protein
MKTINHFFSAKAVQDKNQEANMALASNQRKSAIKACKAKASVRKKRSTALKKKSNLKQQMTMDGKRAEGRCDEATKKCHACEKLKTNPSYKSRGHDLTCPRSLGYKKSDGGRKSKMDMLQEDMDYELQKRLKKQFEGKELHSLRNQALQEDVDSFFVPRLLLAVPPIIQQEPDAIEPVPSTTTAGGPLSISELKRKVNHFMAHPTYSMTASNAVPNVVGAAIEALLDSHSISCNKHSNNLKTTNKCSKAYRDLQKYKEVFPPGTLGFTFPREDKTKQPDYHYSQLEGRTIYLVRWELNIPGIFLRCPFCTSGELIHQQYDFKHHGFATAMFDISGVTDWACAMSYQCNKCSKYCKGNDGRLLAMLPTQFRNAYPVDPRYAMGEKRTHIKTSFSNVADKLFITHGNGEQLAKMLHELRGEAHLDMQQEFYNQARDTGKKISQPLPSFQEWIGANSPSPSDLRDMKDLAAQSALVSTGVSDKDRVCREMQAVGASTTVCNDHTYAFLKNYIAEDIKNAKCGHTIGVDTGEIASVAIVINEEQICYAHQAEQFSRRPNVKPKVHVSDICPKGIKLWQKLFAGVTCQLGWFHFLQRITKTLRIEHHSYRLALAILQECVYWFDVGDLAHVKRCLEDGLLGRDNDGAEKCPSEKLESKAKKYRENVRVWSFDAGEIASRLLAWYERFKNDHDEMIGEDLFTSDTEGAVVEQVGNAQWVTDEISKDELYIKVAPGMRSQTKLPIYIGRRGAESKLEKGHHAIAHFANGGMRRSLADFLGMAGVAYYNRKIRYRAHVARLDPRERAKIPSAFHRAPQYTNHLRLSLINQLGKAAGLSDDIYGYAETLPPDNGERFFSEYLFQQVEREEDGAQYERVTNQCLCTDCGKMRSKIRNPYHRVPAPAIVLPHLPLLQMVVVGESNQAASPQSNQVAAARRPPQLLLPALLPAPQAFHPPPAPQAFHPPPLQMFHHPPYHDATTIRMNQQLVLLGLLPYSYYQSTAGAYTRILNASR